MKYALGGLLIYTNYNMLYNVYSFFNWTDVKVAAVFNKLTQNWYFWISINPAANIRNEAHNKWRSMCYVTLDMSCDGLCWQYLFQLSLRP